MKIPAKEFKNVKYAHILVGKKEDNLILHFEKKVRVNDTQIEKIEWDKTYTLEDGFLHIPNSSIEFTSLYIGIAVKRVLKDLDSVHVYKDGEEIQFIYKNDDFIQYDKAMVSMVKKRS